MSRYWRAGRKQSQTDSLSWPTEILHTIDIMFSLWMGLAKGWEAIWYSGFHGSESPVVWGFELFRKFSKICEFQVPWLLFRKWIRIGGRVVRKIVLYIVCFAYWLLSLLVVVVVVFSFVALLNCLYVNPQVSPSVRFPSSFCYAGWDKQLSSA